MEILQLLERNSDEGKKRLAPVNLYLDLMDLQNLQTLYPKLNISRFVRDVISKALQEHETQYYVDLSMRNMDALKSQTQQQQQKEEVAK